MPSWQELVADKLQRQKAAIPKEWLITPPPSDQLDVTDVPGSCGLLTLDELEITETEDVGVLLANLASGEWSSVDVTTAFYKRAIVAQQVVSLQRMSVALATHAYSQRSTASLRSSSSRHSLVQQNVTNI